MTASLARISIVTTCLNASRFIEDTIRSVLSQNYPNLEYVIVDGGSTDGTTEIIKKYSDQIAHWECRPGCSHYDGINIGFSQTTGDVLGWINADDLYAPWALQTVGAVFRDLPEVEWITSGYPLTWDTSGVAVHCSRSFGWTHEWFKRGDGLANGKWPASGWIQQESTFWRRSLWERAGGRLDSSSRLAADFELWARFFEHARLYSVPVPFAGFRVHDSNRSRTLIQDYLDEAHAALYRHGGRPWGKVRGKLTVYLKDKLPIFLRPMFRQLGLYSPAGRCEYDLDKGRWNAKVE